MWTKMKERNRDADEGTKIIIIFIDFSIMIWRMEHGEFYEFTDIVFQGIKQLLYLLMLKVSAWTNASVQLTEKT